MALLSQDQQFIVILLIIVLFAIIGTIIYVILRISQDNKIVRDNTASPVHTTNTANISNTTNNSDLVETPIAYYHKNEVQTQQQKANEKHLETEIPNYDPRRRLNIDTQRGPTGRNKEYRLLGVIYNTTNSNVFNLYGRETLYSSRKWQYYALDNSYNPIRLGVFNDNKDCSDEYGCEEIMHGDTIHVEEHGINYIAKIYKDYEDKLVYIP